MSPRTEPISDDDEAITQVRAARHRISERHGHDPYRLVAYYIERQRQRQHEVAAAPGTKSPGNPTGAPPSRGR